jgi:hypothetical protein
METRLIWFAPTARSAYTNPNAWAAQAELYATTGLSYDFDPAAKASHWDSFLIDLELTIGIDVVGFLQEFAGYA